MELTMPEDLEDNYTWSIAWYKPKQSCHFRLDIAIKLRLQWKELQTCLHLMIEWPPVCVSLCIWRKPLSQLVSQWKRRYVDVWKVEIGNTFLIIKNMTHDTSIHLWAWRLLGFDLMRLILQMELQTAGWEWKVNVTHY